MGATSLQRKDSLRFLADGPGPARSSTRSSMNRARATIEARNGRINRSQPFRVSVPSR